MREGRPQLIKCFASDLVTEKAAEEAVCVAFSPSLSPNHCARLGLQASVSSDSQVRAKQQEERNSRKCAAASRLMLLPVRTSRTGDDFGDDFTVSGHGVRTGHCQLLMWHWSFAPLHVSGKSKPNTWIPRGAGDGPSTGHVISFPDMPCRRVYRAPNYAD